MENKVQFRIKAENVDIKAVWSHLRKIDVFIKALPGYCLDAKIHEGDDNGSFRLGSIVSFTLRRDKVVPGQPEYTKEKIVEFDEENYSMSLEYIEGVFVEGVDRYIISYKLDSKDEENCVIINTTFAYDGNKNFNGAQLRETVTKIMKDYVNGVVNCLPKYNV